MYKVNLHPGIDAIPADLWDSLCGTDYPFLRHAFLHTLEKTASVGEGTGWHPLHALVTDNNDHPVMVIPLYIKSHSWGEYVFDWAWADAYQRNGLPYYPKLVNAIPFTPATGPRFGTSLPLATAVELLPGILDQIMQEVGASSWHCLFPQPGVIETAPGATHPRLGSQYHWFNQGYENFDDFLARFNSRKRKSVRRERRKVAEQGIQLNALTGEAIQPQHLEQFYRFYQATYLKRGRQGYLAPDFFHQLHQQMADQMLLIMAEDQGQAVAAALYFIGKDCLYGRYWGCLEHYDSLHFEACYYQGIDYCIQQGLDRFDPGAQGEHKIQRGFEPVRTWSLHRMAHPDFNRAVGEFVREEQQHMELQIEELRTWLPFKQPDT